MGPLLREHGGVLHRNPACGYTRTFQRYWSDSVDVNRPPTSKEMGLSPGNPNHNAFDGARSMPQPYSVPYSRGSIYLGIPSDALTKRLDEVLDNRLAISSLRTVKAALRHWDQCREAHGWERLILTDDPIRGAKMTTFVLYLIDSATWYTRPLWATCGAFGPS